MTEKLVMEEINDIGKDITIVIIAHRLSTIKNCDIIYLLDKGQLKNKGTFEEIINANDNFQKNANNLN
jgi:ABC-type multidrug transport system fused ATPase/permease subunit